MFLTKKVSVCILSWAALVAAPTGLRAEIKLPSVLADHMVLQRDMPVHLWGTAAPHEKVHAEFRGNTADATADKLGLWSVTLPKGDAGGPFTLTLQGANTIKFSDVLVGDVWLAGGQSNMEYPMGLNPPWKVGVANMKEEIGSANYPSIRLFHVTFAHSDYPEHDAEATTWAAVTPQSVNNFSAIAYLYGREIYQHEKIPIGLIESDIGGSPLEAWMSLDALTANASMLGVFKNWAEVSDKEYARRRKEELDAEAAAAAAKKGDPQLAVEAHRDTIFNGPAELWNAMIAPLTPLRIKGVIFYHGVANAHPEERALAYEHLFQTLIADWRKQWGEGDFPFLYVQLQNLEIKDDTPRVRQAQLDTLAVPNTGMAVAVDVGEAKVYHPANKQPIAHRLALWSLATVYKENVGEYSGPLFVAATPSGGKITATFTHADGMYAKGGVLKGFEVAGADGKFVAADATIQGTTVVASSAKVAAPQFIRYAWAPNPECPLYNSANLPAATFTSQP